MSNLLVQNIKHTNNTQSIAVDTSGNITASGTMAVDTIKGNASAGSMTIVGEGGSNTTNIQQGLAKVWFLLDGGVSSTASTLDTFNVSSLDEDGTGQYGLHYTTNLDTANQAAGSEAGSGNASGTCFYVNFHTTTTSTVDMDTWAFGIGGDLAQADLHTVRGALFGDLA